uniref:Mannosyltransferase n=1 Tax=Aceria tosichella TaxID=561515 RepID=A0A6G1S3Y2_9ACAR
MASRGWQLVLIRCRYEPKIVPFLLAILRILLCLCPQTGYLHPDEFFQSSDISGGKYFQSQVQPVWEFSTDKPIRCMLLANALNSIAFKLVNLITAQPTAYQLIVAPRLIYTLASFIIDASLYKLCQYYSSRGLWYLPVSIIFQTSFICLSCFTRTFSNNLEVIIFSLLLVVVCQLIRPRFRVIMVTPARNIPAQEQVRTVTQLTSSILVGFLVTLGTFNRPTFPCFALVPMLYWLTESFKRNSYNTRLNLQRVLVPVTLSASLTAFLLSAYDTVYYTGSTEVLTDLYKHLVKFNFKESINLISTKWIITPYYFVKYNTNTDNLARYGLHSPYQHMLVNIPFTFNLLGLMFYGKLINLMTGSGVYRLIFSAHRIYALMLLSVLTSTILLSFIPHQEFRFLVPLIVPLVYAFAYNIYANSTWLSIWLLSNIIIAYFYSSVHQAGIIRASLDLDPILKSYLVQEADQNRTLIDVTAFRCFLGPTYQWNIPNDDYRFKLSQQDTIDDFGESVDVKLGASLERHLDYPTFEHKFYFMLPNLYVKQLDNHLQTHYKNNFTRLHTIRQYAPEFNGEELGSSFKHLREFGWRTWRDAFGFSLLETNLIN